ncbi:uncharacterized protein, partial [Medicago truncatula]
KKFQSLSSSIKTMTSDLYLPDECWECIFKFLFKDGDDDDNRCSFKSLSLVSKQFLSISNCLKFSLTIYDPTPPFLCDLFPRFSNLNSLDLRCYYGDLDSLLFQISRFPLNLTSLNFSDQDIFPADGLRAFSKNITTLTSLTCYHLETLNSTHLFLIADCFPLLEELDLSYPVKINYRSNLLDGLEAISLSLFKLRKVDLSRHCYINDQSLFHFINNCKLLEEVIVIFCPRITIACIASAYRKRPIVTVSYSITSEPDDYAIAM